MKYRIETFTTVADVLDALAKANLLDQVTKFEASLKAHDAMTRAAVIDDGAPWQTFLGRHLTICEAGA